MRAARASDKPPSRKSAVAKAARAPGSDNDWPDCKPIITATGWSRFMTTTTSSRAKRKASLGLFLSPETLTTCMLIPSWYRNEKRDCHKGTVKGVCAQPLQRLSLAPSAVPEGQLTKTLESHGCAAIVQRIEHQATDLRMWGSNPPGDTKKSLIVISKVCNDINIVG